MGAIIFRSWFDDSERDDKEHKVAAVAGCVGTDAQWATFNQAWNTGILDRFELPYLHMKELRGIPRFDDHEESKKLAQAIIDAIANSGIRPFSSAIRLRDLHRFNKDYRQQLNAYALNVYQCMHLVRLLYHEPLNTAGSFVEMWLDRMKGANQKIELAQHYAATSPTHPEVADLVLPQAMPGKNISMAKRVYALQVADFVAWECRKDMEEKNAWYDSREDGLKGKDYDRFNHPEWVHDNGYASPFVRRSMGAFVRNTKVVLGGYTYDVLLQQNEARSGTWTSGVKKKRRSSLERPS